MSAVITLRCPGCQGALSAPGRLAGRAARCPRCGAAVPVPPAPPPREASTAPAPFDPLEVLGAGPPQPPTITRLGEDAPTAPCRFCGGPTPPRALKCQHCGEWLTAGARRAAEQSVVRWRPGVAAVLSLLIPGAGQIYKGDLWLGFIWLFLVGLFYGAGLAAGAPVGLAVGGLIHLLCVVFAYRGDPTKIGRG